MVLYREVGRQAWGSKIALKRYSYYDFLFFIVEDVAFEGKAFDDWLAKGSTVDLGRYI